MIIPILKATVILGYHELVSFDSAMGALQASVSLELIAI